MAGSDWKKVGEELMGRTSRRIEEFLANLAKTDPNELDGVELEQASMSIIKELGLGLMKEAFRRADESAPEAIVNGKRWGNRKVTRGTYTCKFGTFTLDRSSYQQSGRGKVMFPLELRLGVVEGKYSPAMARLMAWTIAEMPAARGAAYLDEAGIGAVSSSTLHRIPQDMSAVYEQERAEIESVVRGEWRAPTGTYTVQVGLDGVMVPMDGEHAKPRGRRSDTPNPPRHEHHYGPSPIGPADSNEKAGVAYHEASVGTLSCFDIEENYLGTIYLGRMPEYRKEALAESLEAELSALLEEQPNVRVVFASDGALTHWDHLDSMQERLPAGMESRQLLDFWHGSQHLFSAAKVAESDDDAAQALAGGWRSKLRHRKDGADIVLRTLRYHRKTASSETARDELDTTVNYFSWHRAHGRLAYKEAANDGYPIGTGPTEAAAKTLVGVRMKRAGARYSTHGGQTILTFRAAVLSDRFDITMREIVNRYSDEVLAA